MGSTETNEQRVFDFFSGQFRVLSIENEVLITRFGERGMMGTAIVAAFPANHIVLSFVYDELYWRAIVMGTAIVAAFPVNHIICSLSIINLSFSAMPV